MTPTTLSDLIAAIRAERAALDAVVARISSERMTEPGALGAWSVKDALAHIAVWYSRAVTLLFQAERSGKAQSWEAQLGTSDWDKVNARDMELQQDRALESIMADYRGSHTQLLKRLEAWRANETHLFDAKRFPGLGGHTLASEVFSVSAGHDAEHRADLDAWLARSGA
jgi:Protein of unknown function (DUF1706)